ncbi:hypothetical protein CANINC_003425 [Pichia inconspicua]|uniref:Uncharacterized protein n=1 Tax=Pichia inconspicua TaxID=52247 RepID=A0A4T0WZN7_9ASCO|nr:hypothetical protein CANINC_003425 [[Candida] inconspicua]
MSEYKQAISLVDFQLAIKDSSDEQLHSILQKLQTSISRLEESNQLMEKLMNKEQREKVVSGSEDDEDEFNPITDEDIKIYTESIRENKFVIQNQKDRCKIIEEELNVRNLPVTKSFNDIKKSAFVDYPSFDTGIPISTDNDV